MTNNVSTNQSKYDELTFMRSLLKLMNKLMFVRYMGILKIPTRAQFSLIFFYSFTFFIFIYYLLIFYTITITPSR